MQPPEVCQADFPCFDQNAVCVGDQQWRAMVTMDCHFSCGPGPCEGASCEVSGPIRDCPADQVCAMQRTSPNSGQLNGVCVPCGTYGAPRCGSTAGCGNGKRDSKYREQCDDGNRDAGDGCSAECETEQGWECHVAGLPCNRVSYGDASCVDPACMDGHTCLQLGSGVACRCPEDHALEACPEVALRSLGLLEGINRFRPNAISRDGSTVVGYGYDSEARRVMARALAWSTEHGAISLGFPLAKSSRALAVSDDGGLILVDSQTPDVSDLVQTARAWLWTSKGARELPLPAGSIATDMSGDGSIVVGEIVVAPDSYVRHAFRWSKPSSLQDLGDLEPPAGCSSSCQISSRASAVSDDGEVVVGTSSGESAFRWTAADGMQRLASLPNNLGATLQGLQPTAVSGDGAIAVGQILDLGTVAVRWLSDGTVERLGPTVTNSNDDSAVQTVRGVSADGSVCVGSYERRREAFIWDAEHGIRALRDVLAENGVDVTDWLLEDATAISGDGTVVAGVGAYAGRQLAFIAKLR